MPLIYSQTKLDGEYNGGKYFGRTLGVKCKTAVYSPNLWCGIFEFFLVLVGTLCQSSVNVVNIVLYMSQGIY